MLVTKGTQSVKAMIGRLSCTIYERYDMMQSFEVIRNGRNDLCIYLIYII